MQCITENNLTYYDEKQKRAHSDNYLLQENSADPDEMPPAVAFHLGLHCLPSIPFASY